jgi:WD40 repeat protein/uncharacterized caspase-like protein
MKLLLTRIGPTAISLVALMTSVCWAQRPNLLTQVRETTQVGSKKPELEIQLGHSGRINAAALSRDGRLLVSGGDDPIAIIWDVAGGKVLRRLVGHVNPVKAVAFSPDARFVLTGSGTSYEDFFGGRMKREKTLRLWDVATGKEMDRLFVSATAINFVQFSNDGRLVLTLSERGAARLWNVATGRMIAHLSERGAGPVGAATFSPDGRFVLTGEGDFDDPYQRRKKYVIRLWNVTSRIVSRRFAVDKNAIGSLSFSADGTFFLSTGERPYIADSWGHDAEVHLWNLKTGTERKFAAVGPVAFSPDSKYILSGGAPERHAEGAALLNVATGKIVRVFCVERPVDPTSDAPVKTASNCDEWQSVGRVEAIAFSQNGHQALVISNPISTGGNGGFTVGTSAMTLYNVESGKAIRKFQGTAEAPTEVAFLAHEAFLTTGSALWSSVTGEEVRIEQRIGGDNTKLFIASVSADGRVVLTTNSVKKSFTTGQIGGDIDGPESLTVRLWDLASGQEVARFSKARRDEPVNPHAWVSADGRYVLTVELQAHKDVLTESMIQELALAVKSRDDTRVNEISKAIKDATDQLFTARVWDASNGKEIWHYDFRVPDYAHYSSNFYSDTPSNLDWRFSPDSRYVMLKGRDKTVLLNATDGSIVKEFNKRVVGTGFPLLVLSPNGRFFVTDDDVIEVSTGKAVSLSIARGPSSIGSLLFSPDSQLLLIGGRSERGNDNVGLSLIDLTSRREIMHFAGQWGFPYAFSPDSKSLLTADASAHVINLWDLKSKTRKQRFEGHLADLNSVAFSSDGRFVLTGSSDSTTRIWESASGRELARLISFSSGEWAVVTPEGLFDGSPGAWGQMLWRFNNNTLDHASVEALFKEYWRPGLLTDIIAGKIPDPPQTDLSMIDARQPDVRFTSVAGQATSEDAPGEPMKPANVITSHNVEVALEVVDNLKPPARSDHPSSSGARDLRLFRNGSLVKRWQGDIFNKESGCQLITTKPSDPRNAICRARVSVVNGENKFTAYGFNHEDVKSTDAELLVTGADNLKRAGTLYVLAVGVNNYENDKYNLNYSVPDADDFSSELKRQQEKLKNYERSEIILLKNEQATKEKIVDALKDLAGKVQPEDAVVVYFAGHGTTGSCLNETTQQVNAKDRFYLVPHDLGYQGPIPERCDQKILDQVAQHSISDLELESLFESIDAGQMLLVIDACNSGQALESEEKRRGPMNSKGLAQLAYEKGMYILTAAQSFQEAKADKKIAKGHGYLTYALVDEALKTKVAANANGTVTLRGWVDYAVQRVPRMQRAEAAERRQFVKKRVDTSKSQVEETQTPRAFYRREPDVKPLIVARP